MACRAISDQSAHLDSVYTYFYLINMLDGRTHSVSDLERATGFDRRTIVYYIQQGLVARPGRRGPNTRYPAEALARLQFIRGVRSLQNEGRLLNVTLAEIRRAIEAAGDARIGGLVARELPLDEVGPLLAGTLPTPPPSPLPTEATAQPAQPLPTAAPAPPRERRAFGLADANVRQRFAPGARPPESPPAPVPAPPAAPPAPRESPPLPAEAGDLGALLRELEIRPALSARRQAPGASEQWTEIPITSRVYLSVRGLSADDTPLADAVGRALKKLLRTP
jgi:DNA-binding transcriptional MerR regulator